MPLSPPSLTAKIWPFRVDWSKGFQVTLSFKTDIIVTRSGREQRRATRSTPRKSIEFNSLVDGALLRSFRALMASWQNKVIVAPDVTRQVSTTAALTTAGTSVAISALPDWIVAGATVVLAYDDRREFRKVDHVTLFPLRVFFTAAGAAWPTGTQIHPGLEGRVSSNLSSAQLTDSVATVRVTLDVIPASEPPRSQGGALATLGGREVFTRRPNWVNGIDVDYLFPSEDVDYGRGVVTTFTPINFSTQVFTASYLGVGAAELLEIQQFFERAKGRRGEFYFSTGLSDMEIAATAVASSTTIRVAGRVILEAFAQDTVHRAIEVVMTDGRRVYRQLAAIPAITPISDSFGDDTLIQIAGSWPYTLTAATVERISWLPVARFASDELTLEYLTDEVGRTQLAIQTLEDLPVE